MPLTVPSCSGRRRKKTPDEKLPERPGEATSSAQVMAPTRMKLRVRRRDSAAGGGQPEEDEQQSRESGGRSSRRKNTNNTSTTAAATSSSPPSSSTASASARAVMAAEEASPDSKCPICLDRFNNLAYLDRCLHRFCFPCIQEWSHNKAECPLCKQPFASILHSVRAEDDFKEYTLRPAPANSSVAATVAMVAAMASAARSDHQMRLMLRRHRGSDGETTTRRRRRERGGRGRGGSRAGERTGVWEWYLDSPPLPHQPAIVAEDSEEGEDQQEQRGGADLAERGVIFEGLSGLGGAVAPVPPNDWASRRLMTRLAARQRLQREGGTVRRLRERETVAFRRALYRCGIRVRGVAGAGNQGQQHDITAESFRRNPVHLNRLRPWLRRELTVLYGAHGSLVDIVQRIIMARLARHGLDDTPTIEEELRPFLLARTDHFLHELVSFARSPLSLENYDLQAVYEPPAAALELDGTSSSDSSSVIAISEGDEEERRAGGRSEERLLERGGCVHDDVNQAGSCPSLSAWDDETPGPSYSTAEPSSSLASLPFSPAPQETAIEEGAEKREEEEEECLIVGYKKPIAERTPELVQLSSDTEDEENKKKKEEEEELPPPPPPPLPSNTALLSFLPIIPPSTSGAYRDKEDEQLKVKDGEVCRRRSRARSWSGSSGRSRNSVCTLSPATPGESERRQERASLRDRKQMAREVAREKRRRKRSRRGRERSGDGLRKSSTLYNPNHSIYPAMMRHRSHSPSPFHSSIESGSPLPPSPPDSGWEYHCSQVSPLSSSFSSPSRSSSSSPQPSSQTPPTPSLSPGDRSGAHHGEKPGGKRKYKSRHLDSDDKDPTWRPSSSQRRERKRGRGEERRRRGRDEGRRRERQRRESAPDSGRRFREERSPSVEIIYEGTITSSATQPPARKRRRKRHRRTAHSSSPVIITLDSDSSHADANNKHSSSSSSPLSSQQTVDFSDLPPLPLVHSSGMGGALNAEIGELPVDILDRGSDGSETEPVGRSETAGPIAINNSDSSDRDVDVENVEESGSPPGTDRKADGKAGPATMEASNSDSRLLAAILSDLQGLAASNSDLPVNFEPGCSSDAREKAFRGQVGPAPSSQDDTRRPHTDLPEERRRGDGGFDRLEWLKECRVREEGKDAPPLLKQASPVRTYNRNTPPPLKHKDAGSPLRLPICPSDLRSPHDLNSNPPVSPADPRLTAGRLKDDAAVPPVSTLKRHVMSVLALRGALTSDLRPARHSADPDPPHSPPGPEGGSSGAGSLPGFNSFQSSKLHSNHNPRSSPSDSHPVNSASPGDLHSDPTSRGCTRKTLSPGLCWGAAVDLRPSSGVSGAPGDCDVISGAVRDDTRDASPPVSSAGSRTLDPSSPTNRETPSEKLSSASASRLVSADVRPPSPKSTAVLHSASSVPDEERTPHPPPVDLHPTRPVPPEIRRSSSVLLSSVFDGHLNHTALLSSSKHKKGGSTVGPADSARNHFGSSPNRRLPTDTSSKHTDSQSKSSGEDFELPTGNHLTPADTQWNSHSSAGAHSESPGGVWNTHSHTHGKT